MDPDSPFRFPPPEFEGGYKLPIPTTPGGREIWLQWLDMAVLFAALAIATWLIYKKRSRKGVFLLSIFSLLYFGFWRKGCVCSIGSLQNVALALFDTNYALPIGVLIFFVLPLAFALFAGRTFCAAVCPHGALQDLVLIKPAKIPLWLENGLGIMPYVYLGAAILFAATGSSYLICQYDPFVTVFRMNGRALMVGAAVILLLIGMFVGRPYCRFLCPYGSLLKLGSIFSKWRVRVTPNECTQCRLCEASCPFGAMREPESGKAENLAKERRQLSWTLLLVPILVIGCGAVGWRFSAAASTMHPTVKLAALFLHERNSPPKAGVLAPEDFALERARTNPKELLLQAASIQKRFAVGSAIFGAWIGLVLGVKLIGLSIRRKRTDYEPDRGNCVACARCFESCPNEWVRRGSIPAMPNPVIASTKA